jgi:hypothetical protein
MTGTFCALWPAYFAHSRPPRLRPCCPAWPGCAAQVVLNPHDANVPLKNCKRATPFGAAFAHCRDAACAKLNQGESCEMAGVKPVQIANVSAGYCDPAMVGKRAELLEAVGGRPSAVAEAGPGAVGGSAAMTQILTKYDVTHITPGELSEMLQKLHQAGALKDDEFQELSGIRLDLESAGIKPDERVDLVEFYTRKLKQLQRKLEDGSDPAAVGQLSSVLRRLDWVQKFAVVQSNPGAAGVDVVA